MGVDSDAALVYLMYSGGKAVEGIVLAASGSSMRVAVQGDDDAEEFRRLGDMWVSENCEPVTIHAPYGIPNVGGPERSSDPREVGAACAANYAPSPVYVD